MLAAQKLLEMGYTNVETYEGGIKEWKKAGHRISSGSSKPALPVDERVGRVRPAEIGIVTGGPLQDAKPPVSSFGIDTCLPNIKLEEVENMKITIERVLCPTDLS